MSDDNLDRQLRKLYSDKSAAGVSIERDYGKRVDALREADPQYQRVTELGRRWLEAHRAFVGSFRVDFTEWIYAWTLDWNLETPAESIKIGSTLDEAEAWLTSQLQSAPPPSTGGGDG